MRFHILKKQFIEKIQGVALNGYGEIDECESLADDDEYELMVDAKKVVAEATRRVFHDKVPGIRLSWQRLEWKVSTTAWMVDVVDRCFEAQGVTPLYVDGSTLLETVIIANFSEETFLLQCTTPWQIEVVVTDAITRMASNSVPILVTVNTSKLVIILKDYSETLRPCHFGYNEIS